MRREHPSLPNACQDVVVYNGQKWARFAADFTSMDRDGKVNFDIRDKAQDNRFITDVTFDPRPGQVVYINNDTIAFDQLKTTDVVNLYVPERGYGFSAQPGVEAEDLTLVSPQTRVEPGPVSDTSLASNDTRPAMLPQTASNIPLLALGGLLSLLGGLGLTLRRVH
ncbi:MAG: LPXTG cell wall anchor domain-containing protein [Rhodanobacteraceae bacterium]